MELASGSRRARKISLVFHLHNDSDVVEFEKLFIVCVRDNNVQWVCSSFYYDNLSIKVIGKYRDKHYALVLHAQK